MPKSAVLFDFGGTLDSKGVSWLERFYPIYVDQGIKASKTDFSRAFYDSDDNLASRFHLEGLNLEETVRLQVQSVLKVLAPDRMELTDGILEVFLSDSRAYLDRARKVLERLQPRHALGIVSNFYGNLEGILEREGLRKFFASVADSGKVGFLKPAPELFLHAMNEIGSGPLDTWVVGDSLGRDMKGAEQIGLSHIWIRGDLHKSSPPCCRQARIAESIEEVGSLLEFCCLS